MNTDETRGQIITFYSYKGGTGRSMALANIACILAEQQTVARGKGVLMIDWDLEAPGLHRYFGGRLATSRLGIESLDRKDAHNSMPGLIDLFYEFDKQVSSSSTDGSGTSEQAARDAIGRVKLSDFIISTTISGLSLLKAGRFTSQDPNEYSDRVNRFSWENLFKKSPHLMRVFAETLAKQYAYVLIDSRTGVTDISGITTMLLPEKLVVVFTPNLQSLKGGLELVRRATDYRKESVDLRPLTVFPLVSRVEANEPELRHDWRLGTFEHEGYQPEFEKILSEVYGEKIKLNNYFDELQIQHIPRYAYGEEVAVLIEKTADKFSLRRSYQSFAMKLVQAQAPWEGEIEEGTTADRAEGAIEKLRKSFQPVISLFGGPERTIAVALMLALAAAYVYYTFSQTQRHQASNQNLQLQLKETQLQNADLKKQVDDLQDPIKGILTQNKQTIDQLTQQLQDASKARDDATKDAQAQRDALALANQQITQANQQRDRASAALKTAQTTLTTTQSDRDDAQKSYQDALSKYTASQKEIRSLQARLAGCSRTAP
jgi:cellulose biosynthesis protein BcsQ